MRGANEPRSPAAAGGPRCYDLPGAPRYSLRLGPDGAAYWIERVVTYNFDGDSRSSDRLVRLDRTTGRTETIAADAQAPIRMLRDGRILYRSIGEVSSVVVWQPGGGTHTLTPPELDVAHFELAPDQRTIAIAAEGHGTQSLYAVALDAGAPRWLADADEVYAIDGDQVIAAKGRSVVKVPLAGGAATTVAIFDKTSPYDLIGGYLIHFDKEHFYARPLGGAAAEDVTVLGPPGGWQMTAAPDHVFLTRRDQDRGVAMRIEGKTARALPSIGGGLALDNAEPVDGGRGVIALVAQDTDHDGAPDDARDEVDVCELPAGGDVALPVRHVPRRVAAGEARLAAIAAAAHMRWDVVEEAPGPLTVDLRVDRHGGNDLAALRAQVRALAGPVLAALGDPELRIELVFDDGRRAISITDGAQHRRISLAGIGDATVGEADEYDVELVRGLVVHDEAQQQILCSGELKNRGKAELHGVVADCVANHSDSPTAVTPDPLPAGGLGLFAGTQPDRPDAELEIRLRAGRRPLLVYDRKVAAAQEAMYAAAARAFDRSQLTLWSWRLDDGTVTADIDPPSGFGDFSSTAQEVAATAAFDALAAPLRVAAGAGDGAPVTLRIHLGDGQIMEYDGSALHAPREP
jgi:hypothetical protein